MARRADLKPDGKSRYNCAQAVATVFAGDLGYDEAAAMRAATGFRGGMQMGSVCGAVTGGLMVLGLAGVEDRETIDAYLNKFRELHEDQVNCAEMLAKNAERGGIKKPFCDSLIRDAVGCAEELLTKMGKL